LKVEPQRLKDLADDIDAQKIEFADVLGAEKEVSRKLTEAGDLARARYHEIVGPEPAA